MSLRNPNLQQLLDTVVEHVLTSIMCGRPGEIQSVDLSKGVADVKPLLGELFEDEGGNIQTESLAVISAVPLIVIGGGGFQLTHPIAKGDQCWLIFADRSIDGWHSNAAEKETGVLHRHHMADAIAIVGLNVGPKALTEWDTARSVWGKQGGKKIALKAAEVHLGVDHGQDATEAVGLMTTYTADENAMLNAVGANLDAANGCLTAAQAALASAASANSVPIYGGAAAATPFVTAGVQLGLVGVQLESAKAQLTQFVQKDSTHKSVIVKVK